MAGTFQYFWLFMLDFGGHLFTLLAGCVVTVILALTEKYLLKRKLSWLVELGILILFVLFACFQAWQDQYRSALTKDQQLAELGKPVFAGKIDDIGVAPGRRSGESIVTIFATVTNTGAQSIADEFRLSVTDPNGKTVQGEAIPPPMKGKDLRVQDKNDPRAIVPLSREDSLEQKAKNNPVAHNGAADGFLMYYVGLSQETIMIPGTVFKMEFEDAGGHPFMFGYKKTGFEKGFINQDNLQGEPQNQSH
jgi:hypothetical protein